MTAGSKNARREEAEKHICEEDGRFPPPLEVDGLIGEGVVIRLRLLEFYSCILGQNGKYSF